jgi:hypothetical protein
LEIAKLPENVTLVLLAPLIVSVASVPLRLVMMF